MSENHITRETGAAAVKDAVVDFGRQTVDSLDARRAPTASALSHTASALHHQTDRVAGVAHGAADTIQATADYVRKNDLKGMMQDVGDLVRRYPAPALVAAAALGFFAARMLRRR